MSELHRFKAGSLLVYFRMIDWVWKNVIENFRQSNGFPMFLYLFQ